MEELRAEKSKTEAHIKSLKKRSSDLSVSMNLKHHCPNKLTVSSIIPTAEEHRGHEAAGPGALRENAGGVAEGRADRSGLTGAGPEKDQNHAGQRSEDLEAAPGPGLQEHQQHRNIYPQELNRGRGGRRGLISRSVSFIPQLNRIQQLIFFFCFSFSPLKGQSGTVR